MQTLEEQPDAIDVISVHTADLSVCFRKQVQCTIASRNAFSSDASPISHLVI